MKKTFLIALIFIQAQSFFLFKSAIYTSALITSLRIVKAKNSLFSMWGYFISLIISRNFIDSIRSYRCMGNIKPTKKGFLLKNIAIPFVLLCFKVVKNDHFKISRIDFASFEIVPLIHFAYNSIFFFRTREKYQKIKKIEFSDVYKTLYESIQKKEKTVGMKENNKELQNLAKQLHTFSKDIEKIYLNAFFQYPKNVHEKNAEEELDLKYFEKWKEKIQNDFKKIEKLKTTLKKYFLA